jgi:N-acetylmuramoyl-L-alanine amidase
MSRLAIFWTALAVASAPLAPVCGAELIALARPDTALSSITDEDNGIALTLTLSHPVPWRVFTLADPPRLVMDFREVDWRGAQLADVLRTTRATGLRTGAIQPGWSRLVLDLTGPFAVTSAGMETGQGAGARITAHLAPASETAFRAQSGALPNAGWAEPAPVPATDPAGALTVVLDPGHGGIDPGADGAGVKEADLMLTFARELQEALIRAGHRAVLTRTDDTFVPLDARITRARVLGGDVFLSLHADALTEGRATGATVYTLSDTASDEAAAALAERHDRADLLAGADLSGQDDQVASVLMDLARLDTAPRSSALADAIVAGLAASVGGLHKQPRQSAGFSVLRAPDIPSALIELGYISSEQDRERLTSPEWRAWAAAAIATAIGDWLAADHGLEALRRR